MKYYNYESVELLVGMLEDSLEDFNEYGLFITDSEENVLLWNSGAERILGYSADEALGHKLKDDLALKLYHKQIPLFLAEKQANKSVKSYLVDFERKDGENFILHISKIVGKNTEKNTIGFINIIRDITKEMLLERFRDVLIESTYSINRTVEIDEMLESTIDIVHKYMQFPAIFACLADRESKIHRLVAQVGLRRSIKPGDCCIGHETEAMHDYDEYDSLTISSYPLCGHPIEKKVTHLKLEHSEYCIVNVPLLTDTTLLGTLHVIVPVSQKKFFLSETHILSLLANVITSGIQRRKLEQEIQQYADGLEQMVAARTDELRKKDAQLIQSGKLATLGEMATGMAHEINQPLGGIKLMAQGLLLAAQRGRLNDELLAQKTEDILEQIERINKIITHLRSFARQSGDIKQEVDINLPFKDVFKLIGQQLEKHEIVVTQSFGANLPNVIADHNKLEQIYLNIITNAKDALDEFSYFVNELQDLEDAPAWAKAWEKSIHIRTFQAHGDVYIEVSDNAAGIPESNLQKIFDPFFTTKEVGKGTGLGLSITYGIVREFGGSITVESKPMQGSTFLIRFPAASKA